jgi:hypothetical protein
MDFTTIGGLKFTGTANNNVRQSAKLYWFPKTATLSTVAEYTNCKY